MEILKSAVILVIGFVLLIKGADYFVEGSSSVAKKFKVPSLIIGMTIVAMGTSLPELFTSVTAARMGNSGIAIGNIIGSNVFNILFVVGLSGLIVDIPFAQAFMFDTYAAIGAAALLWLCVLPKERLARWSGALMLCCYGAYLWYIM
mgnify:CR=1 FL=1